MEELKKMLSGHKELQGNLFIRGFLVTDRKIQDLNEFPFMETGRVKSIVAFILCLIT